MCPNPAPDLSKRLGRYLVAGYTLLIVYASLTPFTGWRMQGLSFFDVLTSPLAQTYTPFDAIANVLAYIPFGLLLALSLPERLGAGRSVLLSTLGGMLLSTSMEYAQMYLPMRTSSNLDLLTNSSGTLAGAMLARKIAPSTWFARLAQERQNLVRTGAAVDFGVALFILWMFAQVNPLLPMLGNIFIGETAKYPFQSMTSPFSWLASLAVALNLLMLGCLLITLMQRRRHAMIALTAVLFAVAAAKFIAAVLLLKSWALLLWLNSEAMLGIIAGLVVLAFAVRLPARMVSWCASFAALAYVVMEFWVLDSNAPQNNAMRFYQWKEGHLLTYNGLSHNILLLFPLLLLGYLWRARNWRAAGV